jgi:hypothetical protein
VGLRVSGNQLENFYIKGFIVYGTSRNPELMMNSVFPLVTLDVRDTVSIQDAVSKVIDITGMTWLLIMQVLVLQVHWKRFQS